MFSTIVFFGLFAILFLGSFFLTTKAIEKFGSGAMFLIFGIVAVFVPPAMMIMQTYEFSDRLNNSCSDEQVRVIIEEQTTLQNIVYDRANDISEIADAINSYNANIATLKSCDAAYRYFHENEWYRSDWLNTLAGFVQHSLVDPSELVEKHRSTIHTTRMYLDRID